MLVLTKRGLYCPAGDFHIDPSGPVDRAVSTHAHSDHARRGSRTYYAAASGAPLLKARLGKNLPVHPVAYGEPFTLGRVKVSLHPAGHILGSAQVRIEAGREVWVVSGDYKREPDPTCEPFEVVACDVFVTEATFGTPSFSWRKGADLGREIHDWWEANAARGLNSVLLAYSLGKAQRVLGVLAPLARRPVFCHDAAAALNECYRAHGVRLAPWRRLGELGPDERLHGELVLAPQGFLESERASLLGEFKTAFASGWTQRWTRGCDRGFLMSDHADFDDLVRTVRETGARRVYVQHRGHGALVRHLRELGLQAFPDTALAARDPEQFPLFG
ncbi:MAG: ligase-associated DNA damage response exonuclease [Elusimicrobia bacterium]|nr:ligase-associated DNA damage response exonuclease [Elusimicrobiota bacterium]